MKLGAATNEKQVSFKYAVVACDKNLSKRFWTGSVIIDYINQGEMSRALKAHSAIAAKSRILVKRRAGFPVGKITDHSVSPMEIFSLETNY